MEGREQKVERCYWHRYVGILGTLSIVAVAAAASLGCSGMGQCEEGKAFFFCPEGVPPTAGECGDGKVDAGEQCDGGDDCTDDCQVICDENADCANVDRECYVFTEESPPVCNLQTQRCEGGVPAEAGTECSNGGVCDGDGACVAQCEDNDDCTYGICNVDEGFCQPECTEDDECESGACDRAVGRCIESCTEDSDCESGQCDTEAELCLPGCDEDSDCASGKCDLTAQVCVETCEDDTDCASAYCRNSEFCSPTCTDDSDCLEGEACGPEGFCVPNQCIDDDTKVEPGTCGCGVPDIDSDGDSVLDCEDQCPNGPDIDSDGDGALDCVDRCVGAPDVDSDGDGLLDCEDACPRGEADDVNVYRRWFPEVNDHFYTTSPTEGLGGPSRVINEGKLFHSVDPASDPRAKPVYRWFAQDSHDHFYSMGPGPECGTPVIRNGKQVLVGIGRCGGENVGPNFTYEGVAFYAYPNAIGRNVKGAVPVYRWFYWQGGIADHFYTPMAGELARINGATCNELPAAQRRGDNPVCGEWLQSYTYEGIAFWAALPPGISSRYAPVATNAKVCLP